MNIMITDDAFDAIVDAVRRGRQDKIELGGSLVAHEDEKDVLIAYAVPTGPDAEQEPARLRTDATFQNAALDRVRSRLPDLSYVGDWHVHPMWLPQLSATDRDTAREILLREGTHRAYLVLLLGTCAAGCEPIVLAFVAQLDSGDRLRVDERPMRRVASTSAEIARRLGRPLPPLTELLTEPAGTVQTVAHASAERIENDLTAIRVELGADTHLWMADDILGATIQREKREAIVLFPPEYPLGAPQVFSGSLKHGPIEPVVLPYAWSSRHCLLDPVEDALGMTPPCKPPAPTSSWLRRIFDALLQVRSLPDVTGDQDRPGKRPPRISHLEAQP